MSDKLLNTKRKRKKGNKLFERTEPLRDFIDEFIDDLDDESCVEELAFLQSELRRLSRKIKKLKTKNTEKC